jgi:hypothetical protein
MRLKIISILVVLPALLSFAPIPPAVSQVPQITLRVSPLSINFRAADPDQDPAISADNLVLVEISVEVSRPWRLTLRAEGDLKGDRGGSIPISNISWTPSSSPPFVNGNLVSRNPQLAASGQGPAAVNGELNFFLKNSWNYQSDEYTQAVTFILAIL